MKTPILCLVGGMFLVYFTVVIYAIYRGRNVKASLKLPFAVFSFEAKEPGAEHDPATLKERFR